MPSTRSRRSSAQSRGHASQHSNSSPRILDTGPPDQAAFRSSRGSLDAFISDDRSLQAADDEARTADNGGAVIETTSPMHERSNLGSESSALNAVRTDPLERYAFGRSESPEPAVPDTADVTAGQSESLAQGKVVSEMVNCMTQDEDSNAEEDKVLPCSNGKPPIVDHGVQTEFAKKKHIKKKQIFGMKRPAYVQGGQQATSHYDYEQKYPPDELGEEMGPNARVWHVYLDEAAAYDADMIEGWKDTLDVLLVFAGLFSAVVTTFVVQTSQALSPDYGQVTASLLTELIQIQRVAAQNLSLVEDVPHSSINATSPFVAANNDRWVNGFWFTSLSLSLATALVSVLVKQWLQHYVSAVSGTPQKQAQFRQFRFNGLERWHVRAIIGTLPLMMHISLLIFFAGLVAFLDPLDLAISWIILGIAAIAYMAYFVSNALPLIWLECPYKTPVTHSMNFTIIISQKAMISLRTSVQDMLKFIKKLILPKDKSELSNKSRSDDISKASDGTASGNMSVVKSDVLTLSTKELQSIIRLTSVLDMTSIEWMFKVSSNTAVTNIVVEALAGIDEQQSNNMKIDYLPTISQNLHHYITLIQTPAFDDDDDHMSKYHIIDRLIRAYLKICDDQLLKSISFSQSYFDHLKYDIPKIFYQEPKYKHLDEWSVVLEKHIMVMNYDVSIIPLMMTVFCTILYRKKISWIVNFSADKEYISLINPFVEKCCSDLISIPIDHQILIVHSIAIKIDQTRKISQEHNITSTSHRDEFNSVYSYLIPSLFNLGFSIITRPLLNPLQYNNNKVIQLVLSCVSIIEYILEENISKSVKEEIISHYTDDGGINTSWLSWLLLHTACHLFDHYNIWYFNVDEKMRRLIIANFSKLLTSLSSHGYYTMLPLDVVIKIYQSYGKFLESNQLFDEISIDESVYIFQMFYHHNFMIQGYSSEEIENHRLYLTNKQYFINLLQFIIYLEVPIKKNDNSISFYAIFHEYDRSLRENPSNICKFVEYSGLDLLTKIVNANSQVYGLIYFLYNYTFFSQEHMKNIKTICTCDQTKHHEYFAKETNLLLCYKYICEYWSPTKGHRLDDLHLLDMYKLLSNKNVWVQILQKLIQRSRDIDHFHTSCSTRYNPDFHVLEQLKLLLEIDPEDENFILYEYEVVPASPEEAAQSYEMYPETVQSDYYKIINRKRYVSKLEYSQTSST